MATVNSFLGGRVNLPKREHDHSANLTGVAYSAHNINIFIPKSISDAAEA
jgi:hypothetical protein